jgi:hypothetical protein
MASQCLDRRTRRKAPTQGGREAELEEEIKQKDAVIAKVRACAAAPQRPLLVRKALISRCCA